MAKVPLAVFLENFVRPLVSGGELHVGAPIAMPDLARWEHELPHASVESVAVDDARTQVLSTIVVRPPSFLLESEELAMCAGLHNALFLVHPRADQWSVGDRTRRKIIDTALAMVSQPLTRDRTRVMARHALLHNLFHLHRKDITVSWWTGRARFYGQTPPSRLTAWKGVRRVREDVATVDFDELLAVPDTAPIVATLLRRTPLTQLLDSHSAAPPLHWEDAVFILRDAELTRAVAYRIVPDAAPRDQIVGPARLAAAFEQMLERAPDEADVRAVAAFLTHLGALFCLGELHMREPGGKSPLLSTVLAPEGAAQRPRGLTTLFALPNALALVDRRLAFPPGVARKTSADAAPPPPVAERQAGADRTAPPKASIADRLDQRWRVHRAQVAEMLGEATIDALAQRLRRHLRGVPRDPSEVVALPAAATEQT